ncbi:Hsp70 family protein [Myxococcota bacterium]|nr:Hsp70 family protein [Myxococcota bacterium]
MARAVIGIDLGTTNSCAAIADENGEVRLIPYMGGDFTIPSVFAIDKNGKELVGYEAKRQAQLNPEGTITGAKRLLGMSYDAEITQDLGSRVGYEIHAGNNDDVVVQAKNKTLRLTEIGAKILNKISSVAAEHLERPIDAAVVTVPAYFNDRQRQAVRESGELAGLKILHIINEPTAAALAYGAGRSLHENIAVYDLGGGTFDISIIEIRDKVFEVKATGGDVFLGGIDFDDVLTEYLLSEFNSQNNLDLSKDRVAMQRLREGAEKAKIDLSTADQSHLHIPFITIGPTGQPLDIETTITRDDFEALCSHLAERTFTTCAQVLDESGLNLEDISQVILVGGQSRSPLVQKQVEGFFGKAPSKQVHPDEAVARGAALYAWSLQDDSDLKLQLLDVLPMSIGIERADGEMHTIFARNTPLPNQKKLAFTTHKNEQPDVLMRLVQGDNHVARENVLLGEFSFSGFPIAEAGKARIEVIFDISTEGILSLNATDSDTGAQMTQKVSFGPDGEE